ncbi:M20 family metallopeptidase [soil metagenome]
MQPVSVQSIKTHLQSRQNAMTRLLSELVLLASPTDVPSAQEPVFDLVAASLDQAGLAVRMLPGRTSGGQLYARRRDRVRHRPVQLMIGHTDTVWPIHSLLEMPLEIHNGKLRGPGSFGMKAGITQIVFALETIHALNLEPTVEPVVFLNSDEEVGSPDSLHVIRRLAKTAERTFVLEPALGPGGKLKTARKGGGRFTFSITGRSAHAGLDPGGGASAIVELSHVIQSLHALNDLDRGITVNVGTIAGGSRPNVVAPTSTAVVDVRVLSAEDADAIERQITSLKAITPGVSLKVEGRMGRPPMEPTPRNRTLWHIARDAGLSLGVELEEALAGGASDGNETSQYCATLDGLGAVGDGAHAAHEHVDLGKMVERTALLTLLLMAQSLNPSRHEGPAPAHVDNSPD